MDHRLALYDPYHKSFQGRPWIVVRRVGTALVARNEAREDHQLEVIIYRGQSRSEVNERIAAGQEVSIPVPAEGARIDAWDTTDYVDSAGGGAGKLRLRESAGVRAMILANRK